MRRDGIPRYVVGVLLAAVSIIMLCESARVYHVFRSASEKDAPLDEKPSLPAKVTKALTASKDRPAPTKIDIRTSPFRTKDYERKRQKAHREPVDGKYRREPLVLTGILIGADTLAMVEHESTLKTHILRKGDTLFGQRVASISKESVRLRDPLGSYTLHPRQ
ncbi:MAG: hypothetical protein GF344_20200 [Chitinivibrionales bacterium]|nr:hypothetical protein [Chitinivibrionales bacterium]MBD3358935.1 hypothetical protein [Chitinivibrionales bacterium]